MPLCLATCQFDTCGDPASNARAMADQIARAAAQGARLVHFPEACLSGYVDHDLPGYDGYDWIALRRAADRVASAVARAGVWVVFGSAHPLGNGVKPHNSLYVVDAAGRLVDRYDKRFCAGDAAGTTGDLAHYTPGDRACVFDLEGLRIGLLICHEYRYPELYRQLGGLGVQLVLHSFHAGNLGPERFAAMEQAVGAANHTLNPATTIAGITQIACTHAAAASNHVWISCANSSARRSCWGAFVVRPDGIAVGRLEAERAGVLLTTIDAAQPFYDSTRDWRGRAAAGMLYSGTPVSDPRSAHRTAF